MNADDLSWRMLWRWWSGFVASAATLSIGYGWDLVPRWMILASAWSSLVLTGFLVVTGAALLLLDRDRVTDDA